MRNEANPENIASLIFSFEIQVAERARGDTHTDQPEGTRRRRRR